MLIVYDDATTPNTDKINTEKPVPRLEFFLWRFSGHVCLIEKGVRIVSYAHIGQFERK